MSLLRLRFLTVSLFAGLLPITSCSTHTGRVGGADKARVVSGYSVKKDIVYTPAGWPEAQLGDLYRPKLSGKAPAVLLVHGGGWTGKEHRYQMNGIAKQLAKRGYVVFNVTYRRGPQWHYPAPVVDLRQAVKWMRTHAEENGIDGERIAGYGYSAGGHLVSRIGLDKGPDDVRFSAIVAGGNPADLTLAKGPGLVADFLGGTLDQIPARFREASPINHVSPASPPVFIYHGSRDRLVPTEHVKRFSAKLEKEGVPYEIYWLNGRGHIGAFLLYGGSHAAALDFLDRVMRK